MFELPDSKRVRREDLYASASSEQDEEEEVEAGQDEQVETELRGKLNAQLSGLLNFELPLELKSVVTPPGKDGAKSNTLGDEDTNLNPEEVAFEFRLFRDEGPARKIVLTSREDELRRAGNDGVVVPRRPRSYYVAGEPDAEALERFRFAAVDAEHVLEDARRRRWGLEKPWKVIAIASDSINNVQGSESLKGDSKSKEEGKRKRPGKKRRIILRTRERAKKEQMEAAKKQLVEKEEHLKEKKKRLNRQKKLKRREKQREKKAATKGAGAPSEPSSRESSPD